MLCATLPTVFWAATVLSIAAALIAWHISGALSLTRLSEDTGTYIEGMASSCAMEGSGWMLGKISSL